MESSTGFDLQKELICSPDLFLASTNEGALIRSLNHPQGEFISPLLAEAVRHFDGFKPVGDQAQEIWRKWPLAKRLVRSREISEAHAKAFGEIRIGPRAVFKMFAGLLGSLEKKGYLVSRERLIQQLQAILPDSPPARITAFGITTRDRPEGVRRALRSYLSNFEKFQRAPRILVADVSTVAANRLSNQNHIREIEKEFGRTIEYLGETHINRWINEAAMKDPHRKEALRFCLRGQTDIGETYGLSRNMLLLATRGEIVLSVDDDSVCETYRPKDFRNAMIFSRVGDGSKTQTIRVFKDRQEAKASLDRWDVDVLAAHEAVLGKTQGEALLAHLEASASARLSKIHHLSFDDLSRNRNPILMSFSGHVGDSGSGSNMGFLFEEFDHPDLDVRMRSREITKISNEYRIHDDGPSMTIFYGFDNRKALPPFQPHFRLEDMLFKDMIKRICPDARLAYVPYALEHSPLNHRVNPGVSSPHDVFFTMYEIISAILRTSSRGVEPSEDFTEGKKAIAHALFDFVERPFEMYKRRLTEVLLHEKFNILVKQRAALKAQKKLLPHKVVDDLQGIFKNSERLLSGDQILADMALIWSGRSPRECEELNREMIRKMAEAVLLF